MKSWKLLAVTATLITALAGCSSVSLQEDATLSAGSQGSTQSNAIEMNAVNPFEDPSNPLSQRSIYFAFDSYDVSDDYISVIEAHAKWLLAHPEVKIVIQGNTDNRGGREYNLALGQKRSEAVKQRLLLLGVPAERIESISFGKEKPVALGDTEEAWAQNRRADIVYPETVFVKQEAISKE